MPIQSPTNEDIAALLEQIADQLEQQEDNPYRIQAFRRGAENVRHYEQPLTSIISQEGGRALTRIEGIGQGRGHHPAHCRTVLCHQPLFRPDPV